MLKFGSSCMCRVEYDLSGLRAVDGFFHFLAAEGHGVARQFGHVEALEQPEVVVGVFLWQHESLVGLPVAVEVGKVGACVVPVVAPRAEGHPTSVAAPGVETVGLLAVGCRQRAGDGLRLAQVAHPQVGILVPDVELSVSGQCVEQIAAVGADAYLRRAFPAGGAEHQCVRGAERLCAVVEIHVQDVVTQFPVVFHGVSGLVFWGEGAHGRHMGGREVQPASVGRPMRERFQHRVGLQDVAYAPVRVVVEYEVRSDVLHFDFFGVADVERLVGLVGREHEPWTGGMPGRISGTVGRFRREPHLLRPPVVADHGAALVAAHVKHHPPGVLPLVVVAVHAAVFLGFVHRLYLERGEVALVDAHALIGDISRFDEPVGEETVDRFGGDVKHVGTQHPPSFAVFHVKACRERIAFVLF